MSTGTLRTTRVMAVLLLGAATAQAQTVIKDGNNALGIEDLEVDGVLYDVTFEFTSAEALYGPCCVPPPVPPFDVPESNAANASIAALLTSEGILGVTDQGFDSYDINQTFLPFVGQLDDKAVNAGADTTGGGTWEVYVDNEVPPKPDTVNRDWTESLSYASFELASGTPAPAIDFSADPATIDFGASSNLSWSVQNATSCTGSMGSGGWAGDKDPVSGSEDVFPMVTSTYVLTCAGAGGESDEDVTVTVPEPHAALAMLAALAGLGVVGRMRRRAPDQQAF